MQIDLPVNIFYWLRHHGQADLRVQVTNDKEGFYCNTLLWSLFMSNTGEYWSQVSEAVDWSLVYSIYNTESPPVLPCF